MAYSIKNMVQKPMALAPDNFTSNMWGGHWIPAWKGLPVPDRPVGESWEFSMHANHPSRILCEDGTTASVKDFVGELSSRPISFLIKFIDSRDDLSVQVHPSDDQARRLENDNGKSEAWYILEAGSDVGDGYIYLGFDPKKAAQYSSITEFQEAFLGAIQQANSYGPQVKSQDRERMARLVLPFLNKIKVKAGEAYRVAPGTIHAIGRGLRLFEIQETSDITYRIWDWNRPDAEQREKNNLVFRPLHLDKAKHVLSFQAHEPEYYRIPSRPLSAEETRIIEEDENRFSANLICLKKGDAPFFLHPQSQFSVLTCIEGQAVVSYGGKTEGVMVTWGVLYQGRTLVIPAALSKVQLLAETTGTKIIKSF